MRIIVNGQERELELESLSDLWAEESRAREVETPRGYAMALNGQLVRREHWDATRITAGDRIEIVRAFAGG